MAKAAVPGAASRPLAALTDSPYVCAMTLLSPPLDGVSRRAASPRPMVAWLLCVAALVFMIILVGGLTRLTDSGLSIVEWKPLTGWIPPLSDADWEAEFANYRQYPEFQKINHTMTLAEFRTIFWFEYWHRVLGRVIGLAFAIPFFLYLLRRQLDRPLGWRLASILVLIGVQGALGWWMVKSGLVDRPDVSHIRLTAHLGLALFIYLLIVQTVLDLRLPRRGRTLPLANGVLFLVFFQALLGAMVAGLDAGLIYNTWPLMDGSVAPTAIFHLSPWWLNFLEQPDMVQFQHRMVGYAAAAAVVWLWWRLRGTPQAGFGRLALAVTAVQVALGIFTLVYQVQIALAALHQAGAVLLLSVLLVTRHLTRPAS
jgi:cytochrome c oxidase assembly protein subunit 15